MRKITRMRKKESKLFFKLQFSLLLCWGRTFSYLFVGENETFFIYLSERNNILKTGEKKHPIINPN